MPLICYVERDFKPATLETISTANKIIAEFRAQGYDLTLRQLYYQFVARDLLAENSQKEYKRLGSIINDARLAGLIDWDYIVDRTRNLQRMAHWDSPQDLIKTCVHQFRVDRWVGQPRRPEVWIEKDALVGVIEGVCQELDVSYFSCRGYTSQSEMWSAAQRLQGYWDNHRSGARSASPGGSRPFGHRYDPRHPRSPTAIYERTHPGLPTGLET